eukprot:CAMPEP_0198283378 /NCGR_PEP_ID=MMETSP1449-20131203/2987_1 /TAXON_ID=420275 /ORGANISM="Attheya septentrionalis, Strain CCMP2084" /LENGTH=682 /DNA_ID=CAMNT_0043979963 /DNA_START=351 /DNA_END=2399 /DNA_ORIENTATION=+
MEMRLGILLICVVVALSGIYWTQVGDSHNIQTTNRSSRKDPWKKGGTHQDDCHDDSTHKDDDTRNQHHVSAVSTRSSTLVIHPEPPASHYAPKQFSLSSIILSLSNTEQSSYIIPVVETLFKEGIVQIHNNSKQEEEASNQEEKTSLSLDKLGAKQKKIRLATTILPTDESESRRILSMTNHPCFFEYPIPNNHRNENEKKKKTNNDVRPDDCWNPSMLPEELFHFVDQTGRLLTEAFLLLEKTAHEGTKHNPNMGSRIETEAISAMRSLTTTTSLSSSQGGSLMEDTNDGSILATPISLASQEGPALHFGKVRTSVQFPNPHYVLHSQERMHFISTGRHDVSQTPWNISSSAGLFVVLARIPSWTHDSDTNKPISTEDDANKGIDSINGDKPALLYMERRKNLVKVASLLSSNEIYVLIGEDAVQFLATKDKQAMDAPPFGVVPQLVTSEDMNDEGKQRGEVWYSRTYQLLNRADDGKIPQQKESQPCTIQSDATSGVANKGNGVHHGHMQPGHDETMEPDDDVSFCKRTEHPMVMFMDGWHWSMFGTSRTECLAFYFSRWNLDTYAKFAGALLVAMLLSILTEGLSNLRQAAHKWLPRGKCRKAVILIIHVLQNFMGYIIMLASMAYSMELTLAVVVGLMLGHFLFFDDSSQQQRHSHPPTLGSSRQAVAPEPRQHNTII